MVFLLLWLVSNVLCFQSFYIAAIPFRRRMPWYSATILIVFGTGLGVFSFIVAIFSLATFVDGVK